MSENSQEPKAETAEPSVIRVVPTTNQRGLVTSGNDEMKTVAAREGDLNWSSKPTPERSAKMTNVFGIEVPTAFELCRRTKIDTRCPNVYRIVSRKGATIATFDSLENAKEWHEKFEQRNRKQVELRNPGPVDESRRLSRTLTKRQRNRAALKRQRDPNLNESPHSAKSENYLMPYSEKYNMTEIDLS